MLLWIKALHVVFMVTWFAGLFYLPRLFVYHTDISHQAGRRRFCTMENRLFVMMSIGAALTVVFGFWLLWLHGGAWFATNHWLHVKLLLVLGLLAYHGWCWQQTRIFRAGRNRRSARFFRLMNEVPSLLLLAIVILAVVRPF
ncbi:MAG TPA: CopD family protein [Salinisphaeraceae bacterium]|nr:CopD family protein [Salinisphaeraceae bacterium]